VAIGHMRGRGTTSGAEIESPWAYLNPKEALEAAGLSQ
jgi:hypothetical protein